MKSSSTNSEQNNLEIRKIHRYAIISATLWTILIVGLSIQLLTESRQKVYELGRSMALESFEKDLLFRRWAARHGGVYVPETVDTPSNPYLAKIPERDIVTSSGRHLTLLNPAYMTRQIYELARETPDHPQGHITSLKPIRPKNAADAWETKSLKSFEQGAKEVVETVQLNGQSYLRFMRPLRTEKSCLQCHASQGYKEGDVRGGISVTLPMDSLQKTANSDLLKDLSIHLFIWSLGLGFIWIGTLKITRVLTLLSDERNKLRESEKKIQQVNDSLQEQKEELQVNEESLLDQNYELQATEEMLRDQLHRYEISQKMLKESEERLKALSDATFGGIIIHDQGLILECNDALSAITGYTREEHIGMKGLKLIAPESLDIVMENIQSGYEQRYEVKGVRKDGTIYPLAIKGKNINYKGRSARVIEYRDITERKQAEKEHKLLEQQFQQAQKLESLGVLAGGIAHDFNNILTIILGHCYMARENMLSGDEYKTAFSYVETAGNRAADLCQQMLTYAGKSQILQTRVNLCQLVDEVLTILQSAIKKNVTVEPDLQRDIPEIIGDSGQLQQIIMNLIINAAEAIGDKYGTIRVVLTKISAAVDNLDNDFFGTAITADHYLCLEVTDNGCGMDEETQKRIFEPFYTTKFTGRGLGMSAIHGIIKSHEALLYLNSKQGEGTTFKVYFPVPQSYLAVKNGTVPLAISDGSSCTILLVDDEQGLLDIGTNLLEAMGHEVFTATNGREALEKFRELSSEIDIILLDLMMPVMGGAEVYNELRKIDVNLPIIICSGYGLESVESLIKDDPYCTFVHKPYRPNELRDAITIVKK